MYKRIYVYTVSSFGPFKQFILFVSQYLMKHWVVNQTYSTEFLFGRT